MAGTENYQKYNDEEKKLVEEIVEKATKWGKETERIKSVDAYKSYLRTFNCWFYNANKEFPQHIHDMKDEQEVRDKVKKAKKRLPFDYSKVLIYLSLLEKTGDRLYAITVSNMMLEFVQETRDIFCKIDIPDNVKDNLRKNCSGYALLNDYLLFNKYQSSTEVDSDIEKEHLNKIHKINKKYLYHQLDGMADLLVAVGGEKEFFTMAIEGSYFFDKELICKVEPVEKQIDDKTYKIWQARNTTDNNIKDSLPITQSQEVKYKNGKEKTINFNYYKYKFGEEEFVVEIDPNGNRFVCDLINKSTNLNLGSGKNSIIQNTIISHVWGQAYNPRYFKSLWNIALVPAWANSLMDKEKCEEHTLASKMRATVMEICKHRYPEETENEEVVNKSDIQKGKYLINVIKKKDEKTGAIRIVKENETLL